MQDKKLQGSIEHGQYKMVLPQPIGKRSLSSLFLVSDTLV